MMKSMSLFKRGSVWLAALLIGFTSVSCMTTYDAYGRPQQSVDPGLAVAGVAAAGLIGYALNDGGGHRHHHHHRHYHRPHRGYYY